jgi:hypothetical protein
MYEEHIIFFILVLLECYANKQQHVRMRIVVKGQFTLSIILIRKWCIV